VPEGSYDVCGPADKGAEIEKTALCENFFSHRISSQIFQLDRERATAGLASGVTVELKRIRRAGCAFVHRSD